MREGVQTKNKKNIFFKTKNISLTSESLYVPSNNGKGNNLYNNNNNKLINNRDFIIFIGVLLFISLISSVSTASLPSYKRVIGYSLSLYPLTLFLHTKLTPDMTT